MLINTVEINLEQTRQELIKVFNTGYACHLWGPPGIGKTELIYQIAEENGFDVETVLLGTKMAGEAGGLPMLNSKVTTWSCPDYISRCLETKKPTILFFDELNTALPDVQVAAYQILRERRLRGHKLPDHIKLVAAGNRPEDLCITNEMSAALMSRMIHYVVKVDDAVWLRWGEAKNCHPYILGFIKARPKYLNEEYIETDYQAISSHAQNEENGIKPTPRGWVMVSDLLHQSETQSTIQISAPGIVGQISALALETFIRRNEDLHPIEDYFKNANNKSKIQKMAPSSIDQAYGLVYNLVYFCKSTEHYAVASQILAHIGEVDDGFYRRETQLLGISQIVGRVRRQGGREEMVKLAKNSIFQKFGKPFVESQSTMMDAFDE
jgi:hypothetical protein